MSLGGPVLRQHVVEFIRGTGLKTDGVVDATSTNGPWTWTVPAGVVDLVIDGCGAGQSGAAGAYQTSALSAGGGCGGAAGMYCRDYRAKVVPGASLTVTVGAGGTGAATVDGTYANGGNTTVAGLLPNFLTFSGTLELRGADPYLGPPTSSTSAVATNGGGSGTAGADGAAGQSNDSNPLYIPMYWVTAGGSQGGGGKASAAAGANGGFLYYTYSSIAQFPTAASNWGTVATGTTAGGVSMGAGGRGAPSFFSGVSPAGGGGDAVGTSAGSGDYGAGGGGGGGSGTARRKGGDGGNGYIRITYWAAD